MLIAAPVELLPTEKAESGDMIVLIASSNTPHVADEGFISSHFVNISLQPSSTL